MGQLPDSQNNPDKDCQISYVLTGSLGGPGQEPIFTDTRECGPLYDDTYGTPDYPRARISLRSSFKSQTGQ